jgi:hypothetical protein
MCRVVLMHGVIASLLRMEGGGGRSALDEESLCSWERNRLLVTEQRTGTYKKLQQKAHSPPQSGAHYSSGP